MGANTGSTYQRLHWTDVVDSMEKVVGRPALEKAYFGKGPAGVTELFNQIDKKCGEGTMQQIIDMANKNEDGWATTAQWLLKQGT